MIYIDGKKVSPRKVKFLGYKKNNVSIAKGSSIFSDTYIGSGTRINGKLIVKGRGSFSVGRYCALGDGIRVITQNHSADEEVLSLQLQFTVYGKTSIEAANVVIGHNVWIGDSAIILPGVEIGSNAIVGAGTVVTKNVKEYEVVVGNPGRVIKNRFRNSFRLSSEEWKLGPFEIGKVLTREK